MPDVHTLTPSALAGLIDHTFLKPFGTPADIEKLCQEAAAYHFAMVAVNPAEVETCVRLLQGTGVRTGAAVGFPLGQNTSPVKALENARFHPARRNRDRHRDQRPRLQAGRSNVVRAEIADMVRACRPAGIISKVILETCYLTDEQKREVCHIAAEEGADFVKTSTGFGAAGATAEDIALMRAAVGPEMGVKAAGGVRTLAAALDMIRAGATRIGTSAGVTIVEQLRARQNAAARGRE